MEFDPDVIAHVKGLTGLKAGPREATAWNVHEWSSSEPTSPPSLP